MKIGLICPYHIFRGGGVQECVLALQTELKNRGHDVKIITPLPRDTEQSEHKDIIFVGTSANVKSPFHTTAQVSVNLDTDMLTDMLSSENFDVLHFHEPWVPIMSRQLLMRSDTAHVATFHAKLPETVMSKTIERVITPYTKSVMKSLHCLTAVSDAAAAYVQTLTDEPISIIPNGIDLSRYSLAPDSVNIHAQKILFIGRLEKRKGIKYLLRAFEQVQLQFPHIQLQIAGDGPDRSKLEDYVKNNEVKNVEFLGFVSEERKHQLLNEADLFCSLAPYGESFGIVLLETMAKGLVTIAADNPGYRAVLKGRGRLSIVNPRDTDQVARQIELLLSDSELRALWRKWATNEVQQYAYPKVVDQYEALYKKAITLHGK